MGLTHTHFGLFPNRYGGYFTDSRDCEGLHEALYRWCFIKCMKCPDMHRKSCVPNPLPKGARVVVGDIPNFFAGNGMRYVDLKRKVMSANMQHMGMGWVSI